MSALNAQHPDFKLTFEIAIIEHLGLNLYSEVHSAISELIANAYDADAKLVTVKLPIGEQIGLQGQEIVIEDDGHGMRYEEAKNLFLRIGRNRRMTGAAKSKSGKRKAIGRKGIGKLAGFGIADEIRVRSVAAERYEGGNPVGQHYLTEFVLDLDKIVQSRPVTSGQKVQDASEQDGEDGSMAPDVTREYQPELIHVDEPTDEPVGTVIRLTRLRPLDALEEDDFLTRLRRKFTIFGNEFVVNVVDLAGTIHELSLFDVECEFRFPEINGGPNTDGWDIAEVITPRLGRKEVRYWVGFTKTPIRQNANRGVAVLANGKQVQEPFEFKLSGGTTGQFGLQYLTGQIVADWLDEGSVDVIASDRASVRWSEPNAAALLKWGEDKLKQLLGKWIELRAAKTDDAVKELAPDIHAQINAYRGPAREELKRVVDRVSSAIASVEEQRRVDVVRSIVNAYSHQHVRDMFQKIVDIPDHASFAVFVEALREWDVMDAVLTYQDLSVKAQALQIFDTLVKGGATEVKSSSGHMSLHEFLSDHPWLLDPAFNSMESEVNLDKFLYDKFRVDVPKTSDKRADFIAVYRDDEIKIIEIKSAKSPIDERGLNNLMYYHKRAKDAAFKTFGAGARVKSMLVYNGDTSNEVASGLLDTVQSNPEIEVRTWDSLLLVNTMIYKEMLARVKAKNPDDPRILALQAIAEQRAGAAIQTKDRLALAKKAVPKQGKRGKNGKKKR